MENMTERNIAKYIILEEARHDLLNIRRFTVRNWNKKQSTTYIGELKEVFTLLVMNPAVGDDQSRDFIRDNIKSFVYKGYVIYYKKTGIDIAIIGVFHHLIIPDSHIRKREA